MTDAPSSLGKAFQKHGESRGFTGSGSAPEQLELLRDEDGKLPSNVFQRLRQQGEGEARGRGRPPGAGNRVNEDFARLYTHMFGDPVLSIGHLANTPLDQLCELVLIAEGARDREERLLELVDLTMEMIADTRKVLRGMNDGCSVIDPEKLVKALDKLSHMTERVIDMAKGLKSKPGDLGIKALNLVLAAHKTAAEYVRSKKPVEANINLGIDGVMVMPGRMGQRETTDERAAFLETAGREIAKALANGMLEPRQLENMRLNDDGQLVDAEVSEVDPGEDDDDGEGEGEGEGVDA